MRPFLPPTRPRRTPRRVAVAALAVVTAGCQIASGTTTGVPGEQMQAAALSDLDIEALDLAGVGTGPISWWGRADDPMPNTPLTVAAPFTPSADFWTVEILHPDVAAADGHPARDAEETPPNAPEVVLRPAWSTRIDNRSSTATTNTISDDTTVSFATPGSPGQHDGDEQVARTDVAAVVEAPARTCLDVVALQVWQLGPPEVEAMAGDVQAEYLGLLMAHMPCA